LDSGIIIRLIEGADGVRLPIEERLKTVPSTERVLVVSRLSRLECRCKPLRENDTKLLRIYDTFFAQRKVRVREIDAAVIEEAASIRAAVGLKAPDAIHAATAVLAGVTDFGRRINAFASALGWSLKRIGLCDGGTAQSSKSATEGRSTPPRRLARWGTSVETAQKALPASGLACGGLRRPRR
jgi:uncharacterized protein